MAILLQGWGGFFRERDGSRLNRPPRARGFALLVDLGLQRAGSSPTLNPDVPLFSALTNRISIFHARRKEAAISVDNVETDWPPQD